MVVRIAYKIPLEVSIGIFLCFIIMTVLILGLIYRWKKEIEYRQRMERKLELYDMHKGPMRQMADDVRKRQHGFDNHLQTMISMHYTTDDYEHLAEEQMKYCNIMIENGRYHCLLECNWPVVMGFLYSKFLGAEDKGIKVYASVKIAGPTDKIPEYVMAEVLGILLDNAIEALDGVEEPVIYFTMDETEGFCVEIGNPTVKIFNKEIGQMFHRGYTTKRGHMGLGLYKLAEYSKKYRFELKVLKLNFLGRECICFHLEL